MKKQTTVIFYFLSAYILLQFIWWGFHLIQLSQNTANTDEQVNRRVLMICQQLVSNSRQGKTVLSKKTYSVLLLVVGSLEVWDTVILVGTVVELIFCC